MNRPGKYTIILMLALAMPGFVGAADRPADKEELKTVTLALHPADEPQPAMKYVLLPDMLERQPGNAAVLYNKLALEWTEIKDKDSVDKLLDASDRSLADLPIEEAKKTLSQCHYILDGLHRAARRESCDWQLTFREENPYTMLLPELAAMRSLSKLLVLQARVQIAEGKLDDAIVTLRTGYAMGRHMAQNSTVIGGLVGMAISQLMSRELLVLLEQPDAPNLYWALTNLPSPLVNLRSAFETEGKLIYLWYPEFQHLDDLPHTPEYWHSLLKRMWADFERSYGGTPPTKGVQELLTAGYTMARYPKARQTLIERGLSAERVDAMPVLEVMTRSALIVYDATWDRMLKWLCVPYWQARSELKEAESHLTSEAWRNGPLPEIGALIPSLAAASLAVARNDREICLLRTIEALRMYAAAHRGQLPAKLSDVTAVPIPIDPVTGQPFIYKLEGDKAVLEAATPEGMPPANGRRFQIRMVP